MDELRAVLELATEEELQQLTELLFSRRFNPLDYVQTPAPIDIQSQDRNAWLDAVELRFRYLAADGITVLRGSTKQVSYRQILIKVCRYLKIPYSQQLSTTDLEAEIFLHLLGQTWKKLPQSDKDALINRVQKSIASSKLPQPLPVAAQKDPLSLVLKTGSVLAVSSILKPIILQHIARQFALYFANYQVAQNLILKGGAVVAAELQNYATLKISQRGMALTAARYGAVRSALSWLGPAMWTWLLADLGWRTISTNYGRIIPTIFALAQIRLTRGESWDVVTC